MAAVVPGCFEYRRKEARLAFSLKVTHGCAGGSTTAEDMIPIWQKLGRYRDTLRAPAAPLDEDGERALAAWFRRLSLERQKAVPRITFAGEVTATSKAEAKGQRDPNFLEC